jgi:hypothetical protein
MSQLQQIEVVLCHFNSATTIHFRFRAIKGAIAAALFVFRVQIEFIVAEKG